MYDVSTDLDHQHYCFLELCMNLIVAMGSPTGAIRKIVPYGITFMTKRCHLAPQENIGVFHIAERHPFPEPLIFTQNIIFNVLRNYTVLKSKIQLISAYM